MIEFLTTPELWVALLTLATLEIVLGVDNLVFISIAVSKLPPEQRPKARRFGLALACITRILLLLTLAWIASMKAPLFRLAGHDFSIRDVVLIGGDVFHTVRPTNTAILHAFNQFARLVQASPNTKVVIAAGNHDMPRSSEMVCILRLFAAPLGIYVADREPKVVGIDPFNKRVDRNADDNLKTL